MPDRQPRSPFCLFLFSAFPFPILRAFSSFQPLNQSRCHTALSRIAPVPGASIYGGELPVPESL